MVFIGWEIFQGWCQNHHIKSHTDDFKHKIIVGLHIILLGIVKQSEGYQSKISAISYRIL